MSDKITIDEKGKITWNGEVVTFAEMAQRLHRHLDDADAWKTYFERQRAYYRNPTVDWMNPGDPAAGGPISEPGYYVLHSCGQPECCRPAGPFSTPEQAHEFSRHDLVARATIREAARTGPYAQGT